MNTQKLWRMNWALVMLLAAVASSITVAHADDFKTNQLEQDVRDLKQQVLQLTRRIEQLEREQRSSNAISHSPERPLERPNSRSKEAVGGSQQSWLNIANWDHVRIGMSELDVLQFLGPPTTLRKSEDGARQTLLYALEIGTGNFLSGSVELDNQKVIAVTKPSLK
jgi:outer membrane murein-binding lipoprotein Lpp